MNQSTISMNELIGVMSAVVAIASFLFNWRVVATQRAMQIEALRMHLDNWVVSWTHAVLDDISQAIELVEQGHLPKQAEKLGDLRARLSSKIDQGRLFFPNDKTDVYTASAEGGENTGERRPVLDAVAFIFFILEDKRSVELDPGVLAQFMKDCRALLYTEVQRSMDPIARRRMLNRLDHGENKSGRKLHRRLEVDFETYFPGRLKRFHERHDSKPTRSRPTVG